VIHSYTIYKILLKVRNTPIVIILIVFSSQIQHSNFVYISKIPVKHRRNIFITKYSVKRYILLGKFKM